MWPSSEPVSGGGTSTARVFSRHADVQLCAIVGRSSEKTAQRAVVGTTPYVDLDEMLETEKPDLVSLCLPNEEHFDTTFRVIQAGYPLLVEKPLVFDLDEADRLLDEAEKRRLFFAINFNHRYAHPGADGSPSHCFGRPRGRHVCVVALWR